MLVTRAMNLLSPDCRAFIKSYFFEGCGDRLEDGDPGGHGEIPPLRCPSPLAGSFRAERTVLSAVLRGAAARSRTHPSHERMTEHDDLQFDIPALLASRLDEPSRVRLEKHLAECASCSETVSVARGILGALEEGGEAVWEEHPSIDRILDLATDSGPVEAGRFAAHVSVCPTCTLEIDAWKAIHAKGLAAPPRSSDLEDRRLRGAPAPIRSRVPPALLGLAAGVLLGAALTAILIGRGGAGAPGGGTGPGLTSPAPWSGAPRWAQLELPRRGGGEEKPLSVVSISAEDPTVLLLVPAEFSRAGGSGGSYAFEILDAAGRAAWRTELSSDQLAARIDPASSFMALLVPTDRLRAGRYDLAVREARGGPDPLLTIPFEVRLASD
jgi:anti-sigma factor RsiW